ncbi:MAG: vitamin K epoxide reductase family protein [bacterium]|nr:vitamin K epoxide reductase family protein [bacterium]
MDQQNLKKSNFFWIYVILALSLLGLVDAVYLTYSSLRGGELTCPLTGGCDIVTTSSYSHIAGVPIALMGVLYYLSVFVLALLIVRTKDTKGFRFIFYLSSLAFLFSLYLAYIQFFVLHTLCQYCLTSVVVSTLIFIVSLFSRNKYSPALANPQPHPALSDVGEGEK